MQSTHNDKRLLVLAFVGSVMFHTFVIFAIDFRFEDRVIEPRTINVQLIPHSPTPSLLTSNPQQDLDEISANLELNVPDSNQEPLEEQTLNLSENDIVETDSDANLQLENAFASVQTSSQDIDPTTTVDVSERDTPSDLEPQISIQDLVSSAAEIALEQSGEKNVQNIVSDEATKTEEEYYLKAWLKKVTQIGQLNYPQEAIDKKLYGKLRLYVSIKPDGTVEETRVVRSSGHEVLDEAAKHIVELASPFSAFPPAMRESLDLLEIVREWEFRKEALVPTSDSDED
ncbi:MAG: energy transducer TonB [Gammaproteobacteria bacterium]|nr:energy transducer TonB [Gammaproteobacteria bacterium]